MHKNARLVSVAFSYVALLCGVFAMPTVGQGAPLTVLNWIPPNSLVPPVTTPPTPPTTLDSLNTAGLLVPGTKASGTIPMWLCSTAATTHPLCSTNSFAMVGKDPSAVKGSGGTTIDVKIVPLRFTSASPALTFDPENNDSCSPKRTPALNMVQQSPLFKTGNWSGYLKPVGTAEFGSLFQRANFWTYTQPKAPSASYEVTLSQVLTNSEENTKHTIAIGSPKNVTTAPYTIEGGVLTDDTSSGPTTWCDPLAQIEINELDDVLQNQIIPALKGPGVTPTTLPIFLLNNVVMYDSNLPTGQQCCILGYHNAYFSISTGATAGKIQTYIVANYDSTAGTNSGAVFTGAFPTAPDLVALANMIAGWMNNPTTLNATPKWSGTFSGVSGCQTILEVAYPNALAGALTAITMSNKTVYHVQDLAYKSWFYGDTGPASTGFGPGGAVGTAYSLFDTLQTPNLTCPP
jgi:hypothetical protein